MLRFGGKTFAGKIKEERHCYCNAGYFERVAQIESEPRLINSRQPVDLAQQAISDYEIHPSRPVHQMSTTSDISKRTERRRSVLKAEIESRRQQIETLQYVFKEAKQSRSVIADEMQSSTMKISLHHIA